MEHHGEEQAIGHMVFIGPRSKDEESATGHVVFVEKVEEAYLVVGPPEL